MRRWKRPSSVAAWAACSTACSDILPPLVKDMVERKKAKKEKREDCRKVKEGKRV